MTRLVVWLGLMFLFTTIPAPRGFAAPIPDRPEKLVFPSLNYTPPDPARFRTELKSGAVAYLVPDKELPLVNVVVYLKAGNYLAPPGQEGLGDFLEYLLVRGGTKTRTAEGLDERLAFLGANLASSIADTETSVSLNLLSKDLPEGLQILREILLEPRYQENRFELRKQELLQAIKQRNDRSSDIEARERNFLVYGEKFWLNRHSTAASLNSITRDDLRQFQTRWFHPSNFVVAVSGDFATNTMRDQLDHLFADWPGSSAALPPVPTQADFASPGLYLVDKDVNQGRVSLLLPGIQRDNPDFFPILIMNEILGGGGFISRIVNRVRSDEGLAYSAGSRFPGGTYFPLSFTAAFQSKSRTVAYAISIVLEEMARMAKEPVSDEELNRAKSGQIDRFPRTFATKTQIANTLADDELTGRYRKEPDYWRKYRERVKGVTADDVMRVAKRYLTRDKLAILVVGQKNEIMLGHPNHPVDLPGLAGKVVDLPLRDPLTMKPISK